MKKLILFLCLSLGVLYAENCANKTFSLNSYDISGDDLTLLDIVADLTKQCEITVIFSDKRSKEKLSQGLSLINIKDYTLDELFNLLFSEHNLFYEYDKSKNILKISYYKMQNFNVNYINASELKTESTKSITVGTNPVTDSDSGSSSGQENSNSDQTKVTLTSTFTFWEKLKGHIEQILRTDEDYTPTINNVLVDRDAAVVTITGTKRQLAQINKYLEKIQHRMHTQVMLDAYIIELTYNDSNNTGINWSNLQLTLDPKASLYDAKHIHTASTWSFAANFNPSGVIKFLNDYGKVEVVSNPKVLTLNNQPAVINVGQQLSYLYQSGDISTTNTGGGISSSSDYNLGSIFVGLTLNIIPEVTENGQIIMRINPVTSELINEDELTKSSTSSTDSTTTATRNMPPDTKIKQMSSIVKVKDGQKVLIGGLIEKRKENEKSKVPLLGDIPLLGMAFSHTEKTIKKTELFIIITPTLIKNDVFPSLEDTITKRLN